jgi:hypothetical protein
LCFTIVNLIINHFNCMMMVDITSCGGKHYTIEILIH